MQTRLFALVLGVVYVIVGIVGFIPAFSVSPAANAPDLTVSAGYGYLLGLFPINILHDIVHLAVGLAGILLAARLTSARSFSQTLFFLFGALTIMGFIPVLNTVWGLVPVFGNDTWLHLATALAGAYFGFVAPESTNVEPAPASAH